MPSIFSKNCVISGLIDHYCLICEAQFKTTEEILDHIIASQHKGKLKSSGYFEKYKQDFIKKVNGLYFCELCNMTFPTATKVGLHVDEQTHIAEKAKRNHVKRVNKDIVVMDKYLIKDDAWNGFVDDTCVLCNTELDDISSHKASKNHILNLIKSKVEEYSDFAYRQIDANSTQCLICNIIFNENYSIHSESTAHKNSIINVTREHEGTHKIANNAKDTKPDNKTIQKPLVEKDAKEEIAKSSAQGSVETTKRKSIADENVVLKTLGANNYIIKLEKEQWCILCEWVIMDPEGHIRGEHHQTMLRMHKERLENDTDRKNNTASNDTKTNMFEFKQKYQKNSINIDLINETAKCKKCLKNIDLNNDAIERHIEEHNKTVKLDKKAKENSVPFTSGIKSNGTDKTTLYTKPVLLSDRKSQQASSSSIASSATEVEDYAKLHGLSHNRADKSFYCNVCCRRLPIILEHLEKHVSSSGHKDKITKQSNMIIKLNSKKAIKRIPVSKFIENFEMVEGLRILNIIINNKYWLNVFGFCLIVKNLVDRIICLACNIDLMSEINVMHHIATSETHQEIVGRCSVVTSFENEFIRELKSDVYHCGYCSDIVGDWDDLLEHLETKEHDKAKSEAQRHLRNHIPNPNAQNNIGEIKTHLNLFKNRFGFR